MNESGSGDTGHAILAELASRAAVATRLRSDSENRLLASILEAAVALFRAHAASIALVTNSGDQLEFVAAAGERASGVVGRTIGIGEGLAGYVVQTGEAMALAHPADDPRFGRSIAERTGFVPDSILAVPMHAPDSVVGVIEILDCRDGAFTADDLGQASIFARQAAIAIDATRVEREFPILLAKSLESYGLEMTPALEEAARSLSSDSGDDFWELVDEIAALSQASPAMRSFIRDLLPVARRHIGSPRDRYPRA